VLIILKIGNRKRCCLSHL